MKISLLNAREAFETIFARSLELFTQDFINRPVKVVPAGQGDLAFRQNAQLNLIYPVATRPADLRALSAEFRYAARLPARLLQTAYCTLAVTPPISSLLSPKAFDLVDATPEMAKWVFLPGNHTIRIIDLGKNRSIVFAKDGFEKHFFLNDVRIRASRPELPAPRVLQFDGSRSWYVEERILGLPINRIADQSVVETALSEAVRGIVRLREKTSQTVAAKSYADDLISRIGESTPDDTAIAAMIQGLVDDIRAVLAAIDNFPLTLCQTHGDFQPANILTSPSKTWVIDWEYSEVRSVIYDYLVYTSRSRFAEGFGARIALERDKAVLAGGVDAWGIEQKGSPAALIAIFLLEDLLVRLREVATDAIVDKSGALVPWLVEAASGMKSS